MKKLDNEQKNADNAHEIEMVKAESEAIRMEAEANIKVTQAKVEGEIELADVKAYTMSQKVGNQSLLSSEILEKLLTGNIAMRFFGAVLIFFFGLIDILKAFMRPGLTLYLTGATTWVTYMAWKIMQANNTTIGGKEAYELFILVVETIIYLTVSCVTWWFGDRRMAKFLTKMDRKK